MKTKNCAQCGKEFEYKLGTAKYCSGTCRAKASVLNGTQQPATEKISTEVENTPKRTALPAVLDPSGTIISPQAQFMITQLQKESDRWEQLYNEEKKKKSKVKNELEKITKELSDLQKDNAIAEASGPTGLNGLMESQGFQAMLPFIGPIIQRLGEKILLPGGSGPVAGGEEVSESPIAQIGNWFNSLSEGTKTQVLTFMTYLSTQDETSVARIMAQIQSSMMYARAM